MVSKLPRIQVRLDQPYLDKLCVIAFRNIRPSVNDQIRAILIRYVNAYETSHCEITEADIAALPDDWKRS